MGAVVYVNRGFDFLGSCAYKKYSEDTSFIHYAILDRNYGDYDYDKAKNGLISVLESQIKEEGV